MPRKEVWIDESVYNGLEVVHERLGFSCIEEALEYLIHEHVRELFDIYRKQKAKEEKCQELK